MSDLDGKDQELVMKHIIHQFMENQLNVLKEDKLETNNSFVFLENSTLNMLILSLFMNGQRRTGGDVNEDSQMKILEELDHIIADSKKGFEEIIALLKEI
ncbi:hypothetical protein FQ087_21150 [Sporosarcina sp. ANT_H38]|uniref:hypothetical protein n=1 Tax=Sporosarcina sp. ANT_H38 TaxID=2597358 RepID=UPI0011F28104|nr:hypothetical protein [Sporosarcina sp. ANT_H38]KAA0941662.1 hypothetical protein FQ087_21150 [Sporosarcina sp. ANT_H38]